MLVHVNYSRGLTNCKLTEHLMFLKATTDRCSRTRAETFVLYTKRNWKSACSNSGHQIFRMGVFKVLAYGLSESYGG